MNRFRNVSVVLAATIISAAVLFFQTQFPSLAKAETNRLQAPASDSTAITVTPNVPTELDDPANLAHAANFAWNEFIALTWAAKQQGPTLFPRGQAEAGVKYGSAGPSGQVVWETYRHRIEVFPGEGPPNGFSVNPPDYGLNAKPEYRYLGGRNGIPMGGLVPPGPNMHNPDIPPFNNLDEVTQITLNAMYAGVVDPDPIGGGSQKTYRAEKILYEAKVNGVEYIYVAQPHTAGNVTFRLYQTSDAQDPPEAVKALSDLKNRSVMFLMTGDSVKYKPPYMNLPASTTTSEGSIEVKAAWRRLTSTEAASKKFYTARVRYYIGEVVNDLPKVQGFIDSDQANQVWGLIALHIIHKLPNAPAFVYATFGQIDNILDKDGKPVEEPDGTTISPNDQLPPFLPALTIIDSTGPNPGVQQRAIEGSGRANTNSPQLYYHNLAGKAVIENDPGTKLFDTPNGQFSTELDKGFIPDGLRTVFANNGITTLPANLPEFFASVEVLAAGSKWLIVDIASTYRTYHIELDGVQLNVFDVELYDGPVNVNRRIYMIPSVIAQANRDAHTAIRQSQEANSGAVWLNYRLVNVQARPLNRDSIPTGEEPTYFLANEVVETNTSLQQFSGSVQGSRTGRITDFVFDKTVNGQASYKPVKNMFVVQTGVPVGFNMGGCMGCHGGQGQKMGGDFSVLLARGRITRPDIVQEDEESSEKQMQDKTRTFYPKRIEH